MRKLINSFATFLVVFILIFSGCKKEDNPVDGGISGPTQTGAGTMSCKIDGQNWSSTTMPGAPVPEAYAQQISGNTFTIVGMQVSGTVTSVINIWLTNLTGTGEYKLGVAGVNGATGYANLSFQPGNAYTTSSSETIKGKVNVIKFDTANKIISGTFEFTAEGQNPSDKKVVTEGKFDVKWGYF